MFEALDLARLQFALTSYLSLAICTVYIGDDGYRSYFRMDLCKHR